MKNTKMYDRKNVLNQYKDNKNLNTRISLYQKYGTNDTNYSDFIQTNYDFFEGSKILEFGSGTGKDWKDKIDSLPDGCELTLSDFSSGMVDELRQKYGDRKNVHIRMLDIQSANIKGGSIDFVIANSMLYHVPDIDKAVGDVHRILKDDGVFYASTFGKSVYSFLKKHISNISDDISLAKEVTFTLENGGDYINKYFSDVKINRYNNRLDIKDTNDLVDYIYSMTSIVGLKDEDRDDIYNYFEGLKDENGNIVVDIEYGIFVARK
jgi:ubiquinone/menaquinone biosynthesis C-methylase UbiE